jgi:hypothetical protein
MQGSNIMVIAMFLAHLVGDYVLQWDRLAARKSRELKGVLIHGLVVFLVTWAFALPFDPYWWQGILFIGLTHLFIDAVQLYCKPPVPPLARFLLDQLAHLAIILVALAWGGYLHLPLIVGDLQGIVQNERLLVYLLAYTFLTMPAWIILKFVAYGLLRGEAPVFPDGTGKYIGSLERILMTTLVALGQFLLVPVIVLPRLALEWPQIGRSERAPTYIIELLAGVTLSIMIGLALTRL